MKKNKESKTNIKLSKSIQNNKIIGTLVASIFLLSMFPSTVFAQDFAYLAEISSTSFLPSTIRAGDTLSIAVDVKNRGTTIAIKDLSAVLESGNQFEAIQSTQFVEEIKPSQTKTLIFQLRVKEDTLPGHYPAIINLTYLRNGDETNQLEQISIPVTETPNNIDVTVSPSVVNPGKLTEIVFSLENVGGAMVSNVSFSWEEADNLVLPLGTNNKRYIDIISPGQVQTVSYNIAADPNIAPGIYSLDLTISFNDANGTSSQESTVGLIIGGKTDFEVSAERLSSGEISLSIANIGSNNAESVVVKVLAQTALGINSDYTEILGNLDKGDFTIATIESQAGPPITSTTSPPHGFDPIRIGQAGSQTQQGSSTIQTNQNSVGQNEGGQLNVVIEYTDTTGERQSVSKKVPLPSQLAELRGTSTQGTVTQNGFIVAIALLVLIVGGAIVFNQFKAKKNWPDLAKIVALIIILFIITIFVFSSNHLIAGLAGIASLGLLWWFFRQPAK